MAPSGLQARLCHAFLVVSAASGHVGESGVVHTVTTSPRTLNYRAVPVAVRCPLRSSDGACCTDRSSAADWLLDSQPDLGGPVNTIDVRKFQNSIHCQSTIPWKLPSTRAVELSFFKLGFQVFENLRNLKEVQFRSVGFLFLLLIYYVSFRFIFLL